MNKLIKFFIICGITLCVGMGLCFGGIWTNGVEGINAVADKYNWLNGSPGDLKTEYEENLEFDSVKASGEMDICLIGSDFTAMPASWELPGKVTEAIMQHAPEEGMIFLCYGENINSPEYKVTNGVLEINSDPLNEGVVSMNFTLDDGIPKVIVFCGDRNLEKIEIETAGCDTAVLGIKCGQANLKTEGGDIYTECIRSGGLNVEVVGGDCSLHGDIEGLTKVLATDSDIVIETSLDENSYSRDVNVNDGSLVINDIEEYDEDYFTSYVREGGPNRLEIKCFDGDVEIWFADALF